MKKYEVNIDLANSTKNEMAKIIDNKDVRVLNQVGAFASLFDISYEAYTNPILVLKTEEPGSKQIIAAEYDRIENVCYDMVNHLINDCIVMGAKPLSVQDAIICGKIEKSIILRIVRAITDACSDVGCVLSGGETSEQPGIIAPGHYILTSSVIGIVEKEKIIDGSKIKKGDVVLGLESSGLHTNGYTLVRKIIKENPDILCEKIDGKEFIDAILVPHKCYYNQLKGLFEKDVINGMAHITGGGIRENLNRILPQNLNAEIDLNNYQIKDIFRVIKKYGCVNDEEMLRTFNMGIGMTIVTRSENLDEVMAHLINEGIGCKVIGKIVEGNKQVVCHNEFNW